MDRLTDPRMAGVPRFEGRTAIVVASDWACAEGLGIDVVPDWGAAAPALIPGVDPLDLIVLAGVLRLVESPTALLDAAVERLQPGGVLLLAEPLAGHQPSLHVDVLDLGAAIAQARGWGITPVYRRLQIGSVIQGYGLLDLHFEPIGPTEAAPEQRRAWTQRLRSADQDSALPPELRDRAAAMLVRLEDEPLILAPTHRVWGRVPG